MKTKIFFRRPRSKKKIFFFYGERQKYFLRRWKNKLFFDIRKNIFFFVGRDFCHSDIFIWDYSYVVIWYHYSTLKDFPRPGRGSPLDAGGGQGTDAEGSPVPWTPKAARALTQSAVRCWAATDAIGKKKKKKRSHRRRVFGYNYAENGRFGPCWPPRGLRSAPISPPPDPPG